MERTLPPDTGEAPSSRPSPKRDEALKAAHLSDEQLHRIGLVELTRKLGAGLGRLARLELELAQAEARSDVKHGMVAGSLFGGSGIALIAALICGIDAALFALGHVFNAVWVALIGMGLFALLGIGIGLMAAGEAREAKPDRSIREARETLSMFRRPTVEQP